MDNELVLESVKLGGVVQTMSGTVYFRKWNKNRTNEFIIMSFNFYSTEDLNKIHELADRWGLIGFTDIIAELAAQPDAPIVQQAPGPNSCPIHGSELRPSKKQGFMYCPSKNADGSFCKHTQHA